MRDNGELGGAAGAGARCTKCVDGKMGGALHQHRQQDFGFWWLPPACCTQTWCAVSPSGDCRLGSDPRARRSARHLRLPWYAASMSSVLATQVTLELAA